MGGACVQYGWSSVGGLMWDVLVECELGACDNVCRRVECVYVGGGEGKVGRGGEGKVGRGGEGKVGRRGEGGHQMP